MIAMLVRLLALRPLLGVALLGVPLLALVAIGLATVVALKLLFFVVLPIGLVVWLVRSVFKPHDTIPTDG